MPSLPHSPMPMYLKVPCDSQLQQHTMWQATISQTFSNSPNFSLPNVNSPTFPGGWPPCKNKQFSLTQFFPDIFLIFGH